MVKLAAPGSDVTRLQIAVDLSGLAYAVNTLVGAGGGYVGVVVREELVVFVDPPLKLTLPVLVPRLPFIYRGHFADGTTSSHGISRHFTV